MIRIAFGGGGSRKEHGVSFGFRFSFQERKAAVVRVDLFSLWGRSLLDENDVVRRAVVMYVLDPVACIRN